MDGNGRGSVTATENERVRSNGKNLEAAAGAHGRRLMIEAADEPPAAAVAC